MKCLHLFQKLFFVIVLCLSMLDRLVAEQIKVATNEWPPYTSSSMENKGVASEIVEKVFKKAKIEYQLKFIPWARLLKELDLGKVDLGYVAFYTEERAKKYFMTESFAESAVALFQHVDSNITYEKLEDLKGLDIGVVRG